MLDEQNAIDEHLQTYSLMRALEWRGLIGLIFNLIAPIMLFYLKWYYVVIIEIALGMIWGHFCERFFTVRLLKITPILAKTYLRYIYIIPFAIILFHRHNIGAVIYCILMPIITLGSSSAIITGKYKLGVLSGIIYGIMQNQLDYSMPEDIFKILENDGLIIGKTLDECNGEFDLSELTAAERSTFGWIESTERIFNLNYGDKYNILCGFVKNRLYRIAITQFQLNPRAYLEWCENEWGPATEATRNRKTWHYEKRVLSIHNKRNRVEMFLTDTSIYT